jgi:hypothetical protein
MVVYLLKRKYINLFLKIVDFYRKNALNPIL